MFPIHQRKSIALFRLMLSLIFIVAGGNHLLNTTAIVHKLQQAPMAQFLAIPASELLIQIAGLFLFLGGLALTLGFKTRLAALGLMLLLVPITLLVQIGSVQTLGPLFKNIAIAGGLLYFMVHGGMAYSLDTYQMKSQTLQKS